MFCDDLPPPPKGWYVLWEVQEQAGCFRVDGLINRNIRDEIYVQISNSWNTKKRKFFFFFFFFFNNYQSNPSTESPLIFKVINMMKCKYMYGFSDIDECKGYHSCHVNSTCTNTNGCYVRECQTGFNGNGQSCTSEFTLFAITSMRWPLSAILLVCHM